MTVVRQTIAEAEGDKKKVYRFFEANLDKLNESLREALPFVFAKVISNERQRLSVKDNERRLLHFSLILVSYFRSSPSAIAPLTWSYPSRYISYL